MAGGVGGGWLEKVGFSLKGSVPSTEESYAGFCRAQRNHMHEKRKSRLQSPSLLSNSKTCSGEKKESSSGNSKRTVSLSPLCLCFSSPHFSRQRSGRTRRRRRRRNDVSTRRWHAKPGIRPPLGCWHAKACSLAKCAPVSQHALLLHGHWVVKKKYKKE